MRKILSAFVLLWCCVPVFAQDEDIYFDNGCNFDTDGGGGLLTVENTNSEAETLVREIMDYLPDYRGQDFNFLLRATKGIKNARATSTRGRRYILINEDFLQQFKRSALTEWSAYSLFAHEIAHHLLNHDLTTTDPDVRKRFEEEADQFSGRVLARMGADIHEAWAGTETLTNELESNTHPHKNRRKDMVFEGFYLEMEKMTTSAQPDLPASTQPPLIQPSGTPLTEPQHAEPAPLQPNVPGIATMPDEFNITLDARSLVDNRWNLVQRAEGLIDGEKIRINYRISNEYARQPLRICVLTNNGDVGPEVRLAKTIRGTGANLSLASNDGVIIWNYKMERYVRSEVSASELLRVVVYNERDLPHTPNFGGWLGASTSLAAGGALWVVGLSERNKGQNLYQTYESFRDPFNEVYTVLGREEHYEQANDHHIRGQWLMAGGSALLVGGGLWLYDKIRMKHTFDRDFCFLGEPVEWEPLLAHSSEAMLGLRFHF